MTSNKTVLIVMDDPAEAWTIGRDMINNEFAVTATTSGKDGFHQLERNQYGYLIVDSSVKEVGLLTFLACSRKYFPETKTIVIYDSDTEITPATAQLAGANFCVPRPEYRDIISDIIIVYNGG
jgi:ActR/RegA family two-component response regulator